MTQEERYCKGCKKNKGEDMRRAIYRNEKRPVIGVLKEQRNIRRTMKKC